MRARITNRVWRARMPLMLLAAFGSVSAGAYASLAARTSSRAAFTLAARPGAAEIVPGASAAFRITIRRSHLVGVIALRIVRGLPGGAHAQLAPGRTRQSRTTLTIAASKRTRPGNYRLQVQAVAGRLRRTIGLTLTVKAAKASPAAPAAPSPPSQALPFTVSGNLAGLLPGHPQPLNLSLTNPNSSSLAVSGLTVSVQSVSAPHATSALPCSVADFSVTQFSGAYPLAVPASATRNLGELGIPSAQWPQVSIIDAPSDQDGCQEATVTLAYGGSATGG